MIATIKIQYSCVMCGIKRQVVEVPARTAEDVVVWMKQIMTPALVRDHEARSPFCHPKTLSEVLIPIEGASQVGGAAEN